METKVDYSKFSPETRRLLEETEALIAKFRSRSVTQSNRAAGRPRTCACCGKDFRGRAHAKTCSNACRQKLYRETKKV